MAKKKTRKYTKRKTKKVPRVELYGLLFAIIAVIGYPFGPFGNLINNTMVFLVGNFRNIHYIFLILLFVMGFYMIIKREWPKFTSTRFIGIYLLIISFLSLIYLSYITKTPVPALDTVNSMLDNFLHPETVHGGILGLGIGFVFYKAFSKEGMIIIDSLLIFCGIVLLSGITFADIFKKIGILIKKAFKKKPKKEKINKLEQIKINLAEEEYEQDNKIVVSSVEELTKMNKKEEPSIEVKLEDAVEENGNYKLPPLSLLSKQRYVGLANSEKEIKEKAKTIEQVLKDFQVVGKIVAANAGPTVTQFEIQLKPGTKVKKITEINKELALALASKDVRIEAPIPGKSTIGIEVPNKINQTVSIREVLEKIPENNHSKLLVALGKNIANKPIFAEINKTPHLLVAGATGSGKSVCINTIIVSILMRAKPDEVKMIMIDPKKVELSLFNGVPHLLAPVVTDPRKAASVLQKIVLEMEDRYDLFNKSHTKNIAGYNKYVEAKKDPELKKIPYIVIIVDELADLMLVASKEVEEAIMRITQMARAAGIHLIIATQRPSTDIITGVIKANIPSRISFAVSSSIDSRTILDKSGAEKLLGKGDMLFFPMGESSPMRIQGSFITESEVNSIVKYTIAQQKAKYDDKLINLSENKGANFKDVNNYEDPLYNEIVKFVISTGKVSTSLIQRRFSFGWNRAARVTDLLEERGIIGPPNGTKPREVLVMLEEDE